MNARTETLTVPSLKPDIDRAVLNSRSDLLGAISSKPGGKEVKERVERGLEGIFNLTSDLGNFNISFVPDPSGDSFTITRAWREEGQLHSESASAMSTNPFRILRLVIWQPYDLTSLIYKRDGQEVSGIDAIPAVGKLVEKVRDAKPLPTETAPATSVS